MNINKKSGILLHPTSLPSKYGIGDLGKEAYHFIDFLHKSKQKLWQTLPLTPVGYGDSPYQCFSAFAGNPMLIGFNQLLDKGLLQQEELANVPNFDKEKVEFEAVKNYKEPLLRKAFERFKVREKTSDYHKFVQENIYWLEDYAFFMALKIHFGGVPWNRWEKSIAFREKSGLKHYKKLIKEEIDYHKFLQFTFFTQWLNLKKYAHQNNIKIIGDIPIFIAYDSSDAWANPQLFELDESGNPTKVAGVPPDYFSKTGQLWGNPHYKWNVMAQDDYTWWRERFKSILTLVDIVRIDHFRGFAGYWEIPAGSETAINGKWVKGPGENFFSTVEKYLGYIPAIAEDLGVITPDVIKMKDKFKFPGMKILQFTLGSGIEELFSPQNYEKECVVYTGTHDNDTVLGWYQQVVKENPHVFQLLKKHLHVDENSDNKEICWRLIKFAYQTNAQNVITPLQDVICLGNEARMNYPGTVQGNWQWRYTKESLTKEIEEKLAQIVYDYNR